MGLIGTEHFLKKFSPKGLVLDFGSLRAISPSSVVIKGGTCWDLSMEIQRYYLGKNKSPGRFVILQL